MAEIDDAELQELRAQAERATALDAELASTRESAGAELRDVVVAAHPELPESLIAGGTAEELDASVRSAAELVDGIREQAFEDLRGVPSTGARRPPVGFRPPVKREGERGGGGAPATAAEKIARGLGKLPKGRGS